MRSLPELIDLLNKAKCSNIIVQFRIHQNRWIKIQKTHLYRVNLNLKGSGKNSHPSVCCFLLLINTFLPVFVNIFLHLEADPVQMRLLHFCPAVLVNSKLDHYCSLLPYVTHNLASTKTPLEPQLCRQLLRASPKLKVYTIISG